MADRFIRLDPAFPLCWEDPITLRAGFDRPHARVHDPSPAVQRLIAELTAGVHLNRLDEVAARAGVSPAEHAKLLSDLANILRTHETVPGSYVSEAEVISSANARLRVRLLDGGRTVRAIRTALVESDVCALNTLPEETSPSDLVVRVERFVEPVDASARWLAEGIPHLLVRFTDESVSVGPIIAATGAPCLSCIAQHSVFADPSIPALAAQLIGYPAAAETAASTELAAATALAMIRLWRHGDVTMHDTRFRFIVRGGLIAGVPRIENVPPLPECACAALGLLRAVN